MPIKETPGGLGGAGYISGRAVEREQARLAREAAARPTGGVRRNVYCACGCGFPTAQRNGYVRGHTPARQERGPRDLSPRMQAIIQKAQPLAHRDDVSFTPVVAEGGYGGVIHLGVDEGSYDTKPMCGALANRATETTDTPGNCSPCATIIRAIGLDYLIKDEQGYTDLYQPRRRY